MSIYVAREEWEGEEDEEIIRDDVAEGEEWYDAPNKVQEVKSDVPDSVYWQDSSLIDCWESALLDFKFAHPTRFAPIAIAPRNRLKQCEAAPLWYGPLKVSDELSVAVANKRKQPSALNGHARSTNNKRQKRAEPIPYSMPSRAYSRDASPSWTPRSPPPHLAHSLLQIDAIPRSSDPPPAAARRAPIASTPAVRLPPPPRAPTASPLPTPPRPPISYPSPPPVVDLEPGVSATNGATAEELLQTALWSWYNAGYQTGLYHAAMESIPGIDAAAAGLASPPPP